jgi:hypothetical protein
MIIDPLYLHLGHKKFKYDYIENKEPEYAIEDFITFLNHLNGKASLLGVFSNIDACMAATNNKAIPAYVIDQTSERTRYTIRNSDELSPFHKAKNDIWAKEVAQYKSQCHGKNIDLIISIHPNFSNASGFSTNEHPLPFTDAYPLMINDNDDHQYTQHIHLKNMLTTLFEEEYLNRIYKEHINLAKLFICCDHEPHLIEYTTNSKHEHKLGLSNRMSL